MGITTNLMVGLVVVAMFMTGVSGLLVSMATEYGTQVPENYNETFNTYADISSEAYEQSNTIQEGDIDPDAQDTAVFKSAITASKQVASTASLTQKALGDITNVMSVHPSIIAMIGTIVVLLVGAGFIALFFGGRTP